MTKVYTVLPALLLLLAVHLSTSSAFVVRQNVLSQKGLSSNQKTWSTSSRRRRRHDRTGSSSGGNYASPSSLRMMEVLECDVAIIGGGPAGCTCALYTSRSDLKTVIVDKNPAVGALAITSHIANYPGVDRSMTGIELLDQMRKQAIDYGADYRRAQVFMIDIEENEGSAETTKVVYTPDLMVRARSLVLATGAMGRATPPYPGEEEYLGQGVSYCATCDGAFYRDSEVAVFGATLEAVEEAMFLTKFASTVHWITPIDVLATAEMTSVERNRMIDQDQVEQLLECENVKHWVKTRLVSVEGDASSVTGIKVRQVGAQYDEVLPVEGAFIYGAGGGSKPITDFIQNKVEFNDDGGVRVNDEMETSVKGVFAIGDIRNTHFKQVVVASSDGCIAAMSIDKYLKGRKIVKVDWIHK